jgi:hypothetical protein
MFKSMMLVLALGLFAVGCVDSGAVADDQTGSVSQKTGGDNFDCHQGIIGLVNVVSCEGDILILPIKVDVKDVDVLSNNELTVLENSLNDVADISNVLNANKILNDVEADVLTKFLNDFDIDVTDTDVNVCTTILGGLLCK